MKKDSIITTPKGIIHRRLDLPTYHTSGIIQIIYCGLTILLVPNTSAMTTRHVVLTSSLPRHCSQNIKSRPIIRVAVLSVPIVSEMLLITFIDTNEYWYRYG